MLVDSVRRDQEFHEKCEGEPIEMTSLPVQTGI